MFIRILLCVFVFIRILLRVFVFIRIILCVSGKFSVSLCLWAHFFVFLLFSIYYFLSNETTKTDNDTRIKKYKKVQRLIAFANIAFQKMRICLQHNYLPCQLRTLSRRCHLVRQHVANCVHFKCTDIFPKKIKLCFS